MSSDSRHQHVRATFDALTSDYDRMNRVMTLGQHSAWCGEVARRAELTARGRLLDIATGTGAIAFAARHLYPSAEIIACDFSENMIRNASSRPGAESIHWEAQDANSLQFDDDSFDAITHGYLLRNVDDVARVLSEQFRVLKPGGRVVVLETCPPTGVSSAPVRLGMRVVIPTLGYVLARDRAAYSYLVRSTLGFVGPEAVADAMRRAGFVCIGWRRKFFTTHMLLWAEKPPQP